MQLILMYVAAAIALVLLGGGVAWKVTSDYDTVKFNNYKSEVEKAGYKQQERNWKEKQERDKITQELERNHAAAKINLDNQYAAARKRLLNTKPGSRGVSSVPDPSAGGECRQSEALSSSAMDGFEARRIDILEQGDKAISAQITLEDWLKKQLSLSNNKAKGLLTE